VKKQLNAVFERLNLEQQKVENELLDSRMGVSMKQLVIYLLIIFAFMLNKIIIYIFSDTGLFFRRKN
jgi:hypothetical protein